jgi:hypothetical protein
MRWKSRTFAFSYKAPLFMITVLALAEVLFGHSQSPQPDGKAANRITVTHRLELGNAIHANLEAGQSHSYVLALEAGQYMRVICASSFRNPILRSRCGCSRWIEHRPFLL